MSFVYQVTILNQEIEIHTIIGAILIVVGVIITSVGVPLFNKIKSDCCKCGGDEEESSANQSVSQNVNHIANQSANQNVNQNATH